MSQLQMNQNQLTSVDPFNIGSASINASTNQLLSVLKEGLSRLESDNRSKEKVLNDREQEMKVLIGEKDLLSKFK
jgi:hypothetical protein